MKHLHITVEGYSLLTRIHLDPLQTPFGLTFQALLIQSSYINKSSLTALYSHDK